jgi:acid phosphatase type 7
VHFVVLDSNNCCGSTQTTWLANDLAATTRKWKFVFLHHTPYSCANGIASRLDGQHERLALPEPDRLR